MNKHNGIFCTSWTFLEGVTEGLLLLTVYEADRQPFWIMMVAKYPNRMMNMSNCYLVYSSTYEFLGLPSSP